MFIFILILFVLVLKGHGEENYFKVLGITRMASKREIRSAYNAISIRLHPDKNQCDEFATEKFIKLTEARTILLDDARRGTYEKQNPYFGIEREEYEWNIPVCSKERHYDKEETIKTMLSNYVKPILDCLCRIFWNVLATVKCLPVAVHSSLIFLKSTGYTDGCKRNRYESFQGCLICIMLNETVDFFMQVWVFLLDLPSHFLSSCRKVHVVSRFNRTIIIVAISVPILLLCSKIFLKLVGQHNHREVLDLIQNADIKRQVTTAVSDSPTLTIQETHDAVAHQIPPAKRLNILTFKNMRSSINRRRRNHIPDIPASIIDVKIRGQWKVTVNGNRFLSKLDNACGIAVFCTEEALSCLGQAATI
ncbi:uncharacterized protein [Mytilus edulis]|uniref:uncharacterized protein n=1 Tax=Mytilus edulis TaxID=6550 RepID=UPI0039EECE09